MEPEVEKTGLEDERRMAAEEEVTEAGEGGGPATSAPLTPASSEGATGETGSPSGTGGDHGQSPAAAGALPTSITKAKKKRREVGMEKKRPERQYFLKTKWVGWKEGPRLGEALPIPGAAPVGG